jgi:radical SAM superfamily enzyme YgiQ (UPF0313 family)
MHSKKLKIYLGDLTYDTMNLATDAFPLNIGFVAAYCKNYFGEKVDIELFKYPGDLEKAIRYCPPDILGLSNYPWNFNLGISFFNLIKKISPDTVTVMGGPNIPLFEKDRNSFILKNPLIDFYVYLEGEEAFSNLVERVLEYKGNIKKLKENPIDGIVHRIDEDNLIKGSWLKRRKMLDEIPSPYLGGYLDKFFDGKLSPMVETNRGCPFTCNYCHEGHSLITKVNYFSLERVKEELDYIARMVPKNVSHLMFVDPNFGMYERDLEICDHVAKIQRDKNYPRAIFASTGKNRKDRIAKAISKLNGTLKFSLSVQSMDSEVLKNISRENISLDAMTSLVDTYDEHQLPTTSEAIIALPGETLKSHIDTMSKLIDTGVENITTYNLMLLNGTELTLKSSREKYGMKTHFRIIPRDFGKFSDGTVSAETEEIVTSTSSMKFEEYIEGRIYHLLISTIWNNGVYNQIFKFMINKNIKPIKFFTYLKENYSSGPTSLVNFVNNYIEDSRNELWDSEEELLNHVKIEENYQKLVTGKLGHNLIQTYNAKWMPLVSEWNDFLYSIFKKMLNFDDLSLEEQNFLEELKHFCVSKIHNIWGDNRIEDNPCHEFNYNIINWSDSFKRENINNISIVKFDKPKKIKFTLTKQQNYDIIENLKRYGKTPTGIGRTVVKMGHPNKILRAPSILS